MKEWYLTHVSGKYSHTLIGFFKDYKRWGIKKAIWLWKTEASILRKAKEIE